MLRVIILLMLYLGGISSVSAQDNPVPTNSAVNIIAESKPLYNKIEFPWQENVGATVFVRGNKLWVIFDKLQNFAIPSFLEDTNDWLLQGKQLNLSGNATYLVFEIEMFRDKILSVKVSKNQNNWVMELKDTADIDEKSKEIIVAAKPFASPVPRIEIDLSDTVKPIFIEDPYIGDQLIIVPVMEENYNVSKELGFVDFTVMQSVQGLAIALKSDLVNSSFKLGKLSLSASGLTISPPSVNKKVEVDKKTYNFDKYIADSNSILHLTLFKSGVDDFNYHLYQLYTAINNASSELKGEAYAKLALFYLANELYTEANSITKLINVIDADLASSNEILFMNAMAAFMNKKLVEAFLNISKIDISQVPIKHRAEIRFWQSILGNSVTIDNDFIMTQSVAYLYKHADSNFLSEYNSKMFNQLGLTLLQLFTQEKDTKNVLDVSAILKVQKSLKDRQLNEYNYLFGLFDLQRGNTKAAKEHFNKCSKDVIDLFHRTACQFELLKLQIGKEVSDRQAIQKLEYLTLLWRGDQLEGNMLEYLGDLYLKTKQYDRALYSWKRIIINFPNTAQTLSINEKMSNAFIEFFLNKHDDKMKPMEALALFYEFQNLTPIGEVGDEIILKFADNLIKLDLLDRATALLNHQVQNRLTSMKRELVINKLAKLHLLNNKPDVALQVLELGNDKMLLSDEASEERIYIKARVLIELEDYSGALTLLKDDFSQEADDIKANVFWQQQNWKQFNDYSEPYLYSIRNQEDMLNDNETVRVLKQAISYIMLDRKDLLKELAQSFYKRLPDQGEYEKITKQLTQAALNNSSIQEGKINLENLDDLKNSAHELINRSNKS